MEFLRGSTRMRVYLIWKRLMIASKSHLRLRRVKKPKDSMSRKKRNTQRKTLQICLVSKFRISSNFMMRVMMLKMLLMFWSMIKSNSICLIRINRRMMKMRKHI